MTLRVAGHIAVLALIAGSVGCSSPQMRQTAALMQAPIVPASDAIFNSVIYTNGQLAAAPQTDAEWDRLHMHAGNLMTAAATLRALAPSEDPALWIRQSEGLSAASSAALEAIKGRNLEGVLQAGSRIYDTCTTCHAAYVKEM